MAEVKLSGLKCERCTHVWVSRNILKKLKKRILSENVRDSRKLSENVRDGRKLSENVRDGRKLSENVRDGRKLSENVQELQLPLVCPNCKSPYWNIPRRNGQEGIVNEY